MKTIFRLSIIACLALAAGMGNAQQVTSPVMTYVPDKAGRLHPMLGIPGAASIGGILNAGIRVRQVSIPPSHDYVLATTDGSSWPVVLQVHGDSVSAQSIQQSASAIARVELSPTGSAAAFFSQAEGQIYVFQNLSQSPVLAGVFQIGTLGKVTAFAISDTGKSAVIGVSDGNAGTLFFVDLNGEPRLIASVRHASAVEFLNQSDAALIADDVDNKVYGFLNGQFFPIAGEQDGISAPVAIAVAADNSKAFVINSGSHSITRIGPNGVVAQPVHCDCTLTGLYATNTDSIFRVTDFSGGPVVLFDGRSRVPRLLLVRGSQN
jgi:hypothetical protein